VVHADTAIADQVGSLEPTDQVVIDSENNATASQDGTTKSGNVSDAHMDKLDMVITFVLLHHHVPDQANTMEFGIPLTVVPVDIATKDRDGLSEPIEADVTDHLEHAHVPRDSTRTSGTALLVQTVNLEPTGNLITTHMTHWQ
jgi:hypothetical protein